MKLIRIITLFFITTLTLSTGFARDNGIESLRQSSKSFASVAKTVSPSVVFIKVEGKTSEAIRSPFRSPFGQRDPFSDDFLKHFFGESFPGLQPEEKMPQGKQRILGQGSGFVFKVNGGLLSDTAYILTNNHVVKNAEKISVTFKDGREYEAKVTGRDPKSDIAVIEIKNRDFPALKLGDSSKLEVGEWVVAIGNPFGLSHTLTVGVVSAKGRTSIGINDYEDFIQTDAAINPGNSGGPLVNLDGEVVGINTAIFTQSGGYMGIGFSIPINMASEIANQLIDEGKVSRGYLGIIIQNLTGELAESFNLKNKKGILVSEVAKGSPAEKSGLKQGDVIIAYRGKPVTDVGDFRNQVSLTVPGKQEKLTIIRNGREKQLMVTIGKDSVDQVVAKGPAQSSEQLGLTVQTITDDLARQFNVRPGQGVVVTDVKPGSLAAMTGIRVGTVILQVDRKPMKKASDFTQAIENAGSNKRVLLLVRSGNSQHYIVLRWQ
ncbi:MAG: DegQ family serine endoprotease [Gammaproteobacteria bacterium]|nr:DegQ family serine endoprotease [Gammaproteobacteria bacterium]